MQRPRRDAAPVAKALDRIDHDQSQILGEAWVLVAVIHHDAIDLFATGLRLCHDRARARRAVTGDPGRGEGGGEQGLIANIRSRMVCRVHRHRPAQSPAVTARQDHRRAPALLQQGDQRLHYRCLAGAARIQVADADHRHRRAPVGRAARAARGDPAIGPAQRGQQPCARIGAVGWGEPVAGCPHRAAS